MIKSKISKGLDIIYKEKKFLPQHILHTLYYSFIYPYSVYCIEIWGMAANIHLNRILKIQKRIVWILNSAGSIEHSKLLFIKSNILEIRKLYIIQVTSFMYKINKLILPDSITCMFLRISSIHRYAIRDIDSFHLPFMWLTTTQKTLKYMGPKLWNTFSKTFKSENTIHSFKREIKRFLLLNKSPPLL